LSGRILQRSLFAAVDTILGAIVASHTHRNVMSRQNAGKLLWPSNTDCLCFPCAACELRHYHTA